MQEYKDIDMDSLVSDGPDTINKNFKTLMSNNAGGEFPTENLYAGMICYRSDEGKIYTLKNDLTTWVELFDVSGANGAVTPKADSLTKTLSVAEGGTGATTGSNACANIGALPTAGGTITGVLKIDKASAWGNIVLNSPSDYYRAVETDDTTLRLDVRNTSDPNERRYINIYNSTGKELADSVMLYDVVNGAYKGYRMYGAHNTVPVANGGTGATSASAALSNLGGLASSEVANAANKIPRYNNSGHLVLPNGAEFWIE